MPHSASRPAAFHSVSLLDADLSERVGRMRPGEAHGRVEVVGARGEGPIEDRHDVAGVDHIQDMGDLVLAAQVRYGVGARGVELSGHEPWIVQPGNDRLRATWVVVRHHPSVEEVPSRSDQRRRGSDSACTHGKDSHGYSPGIRLASNGARGSHVVPSRSSLRRLAIAESASSTTRLPSRAVMSAWSYGGATSTTSIPTTGRS
jgi:hypothetical protein